MSIFIEHRDERDTTSDDDDLTALSYRDLLRRYDAEGRAELLHARLAKRARQEAAEQKHLHRKAIRNRGRLEREIQRRAEEVVP